MAKPLPVALASIGVALSLIAVLFAAETITLTYSLPSPVPGTVNRHTAIFGPGVAATVVAGVMTVITFGWLLRNIVGAPRRWLWLVPGAAVVISYLVLFAVMGLDRPSF